MWPRWSRTTRISSGWPTRSRRHRWSLFSPSRPSVRLIATLHKTWWVILNSLDLCELIQQVPANWWSLVSSDGMSVRPSVRPHQKNMNMRQRYMVPGGSLSSHDLFKMHFLCQDEPKGVVLFSGATDWAEVGRKGTIGRSPNTIWKPVKLAALKDVDVVAITSGPTSVHMFAISREGKVWISLSRHSVLGRLILP